MMNMKECKEKFDVIVEAKENEGYLEWKKWVIGQIKEYDIAKLTNLIKRCEITLKKLCEDDGFRIFPVFTQLLSTILIVIPFVGNIVLSSFGILSGIYQETLEGDAMKEYASIVSETITELGIDIISITIMGIAIFVILLPIVRAIDAKIIKEKSNRKIFYEELLKILEKRLRKLKRR